MPSYFIEKGHHQNDQNGQPLIFYIELCMEPLGVWLNLARRKIISPVTLDFYSFFKGIIKANEIKINI